MLPLVIRGTVIMASRRNYSSRILILALLLLGFGIFVGYDAFSKLSWARVPATLVSADPKCEMTAEERGILTKTTSTANIDCDAVERFKILHPEKDWKVARSWLLQLVVAGPRPLATSMLVFDDLHLQPGDALRVIQDPTDSARVLRADTSSQGFGLAAINGFFGLLVLLYWLVRRGRRPPKVASPGGRPQAQYAPPAPSVAMQPAPAPGAPRTFGRRGRA